MNINLSRKQTILVTLLVAVAVLSGVVVASEHFLDTDGNVSLAAPGGPEIVVSGDTDINLEDPIDTGEGVVYVETTDGDIEFSSDGEARATIAAADIEGPWTYVTDIQTANELQIYPQDKRIIRVDGDIDDVALAADIGVDDGSPDFEYSGEAATVEVTNLEINTEIAAVVDNQVVGSAASDDIGTARFESLAAGTDQTVELRSSDGGPMLSNPTPDGTVDELPAQLSVEVDDPDFEYSDVTVEFIYDGETFATETVSESGTVSADAPENLTIGSNQITAIATDDYDQSDSLTWQIATPNQLEIRDELSNELLDDLETSVEVRFFEIGGDGEEVISKTTGDGTVNLTGLPVNKDLVVDANADGYFARSAIIRDITQQQTVWMLEETVESVSVSFAIEDRTGGQFDSDTSRILIRKPIEADNTSYQTIHGDTPGANDRVNAILERDQRYRVIVENNQGATRSFGSYVADVEDDIVRLEVGEITIAPPEAGSYVFDARFIDLENEDDGIRIVYRDDSQSTNWIEVSVHERGNESNQIYGPEILTGNQIAETIEIPENQTHINSWVVSYEIDRDTDDETIAGTAMVGELSDLNVPVSSTLLQTVGLGSILLVAGLFGGRLSQIGGIVVTGMAWVLVAIGVLSIPIEFLIAALTIAFLFRIGTPSAGVRPA